MDVGRAFSFVFDDENWIVKVLVGGVLSLIPIVGQVLIYGYSMELMRNVMRGQVQLPEWDDWGGKLIKGIMAFVIYLVYALPVIILGTCFGVLTGALGAADAERAVGVVASVGGTCLGGLALLYGIFLALALPPAIGRYLETEELGAAFRFGEVFGLVRDYLGGWVVVLLVSVVIWLVAGLVGVILCGVGTLFTSFLATLMIAYLWGDNYRQSSAELVVV
jgi:hypothetical protein